MIGRLSSRTFHKSFDRYSVDFGAKQNKARKAEGVREKTLSELLTALDNKSLSPEDARRWFVEGNKRFTTPLLNLIYALIACTGLLVGNFNRRGQIKLISYSVGAMVLIQAFDLAIGNLAAKKLWWLIIMYLNLLLPCVICLWLLFFYTPNMFRKRRQYNPEES